MRVGHFAFVLTLFLSCASARSQQVGAFTSFQPNEITPGLFIRFSSERVAYQWTMSVPVLIHDTYNGGRSNVSYWSPAMVALGAMEYLAGVEIDADSLSGFLSQLFLLALPVISNGQLHVNLVPKSSVDAAGVQASAFLGWDTAFFGMRQIQWFRLTPEAGVACYKLFGSPGDKKRLSVGLQLGVRKNIDSPAGRSNPLIGFIGIEAGIR